MVARSMLYSSSSLISGQIAPHLFNRGEQAAIDAIGPHEDFFSEMDTIVRYRRDVMRKHGRRTEARVYRARIFVDVVERSSVRIFPRRWLIPICKRGAILLLRYSCSMIAEHRTYVVCIIVEPIPRSQYFLCRVSEDRSGCDRMLGLLRVSRIAVRL